MLFSRYSPILKELAF